MESSPLILDRGALQPLEINASPSVGRGRTERELGSARSRTRSRTASNDHDNDSMGYFEAQVAALGTALLTGSIGGSLLLGGALLGEDHLGINAMGSVL